MATAKSDSTKIAAQLKRTARMYAQSRQFDKAISLLHEALRVAAQDSEIVHLLARMSLDANRLEDAERYWSEVIQRKPEEVDGYRQLAGVRKRLNLFQDAADVLRVAIGKWPASPGLYVELGSTYCELNRKSDARAAYLRALELDPDSFDAHNNFAVLLQALGRLDEAIEHLKKAVELQPTHASGLNNLGVALADKRRFTEAVDCYTRALASSPKFAFAWNNLGNALRSMGKSQEAADALIKAISLKPDYAEAHNNLAITYSQMEDSARALSSFDKALFLKPEYPEAHMNRGLQHLLLARFSRGWADYEWRWHEKLLKPRRHNLKRWDGSPLLGKTVLVYYEQGLGDTFHFIRYAAELKAQGATVIFECQPVVREIMSRTPGIDQFILKNEKPPSCDFGAPLLSLPGAFQANLDNLPCVIPYIFPDPALVSRWRERIGALPGYRIGIAWQGNPEHRGDWKRSIPLRQFEALANVGGVTLVSLQRGYGCEQLAPLGDRFQVHTFDGIDENVDGFQRTAAIMANLDLIVCADTAIAHLGGAMALPVWVALPVAPDWRWMLRREDSPWYPTLRLFRQKTIGTWTDVFERMAIEIEQRVDRHWRHPVAAGNTEKHKSLVREANRHLTTQSFAKAASLLLQAIELDPTSTDAHHDLGIAYAKSKQLPRAITCFRRAIELAPASTRAHANLGRALFEADRLTESIAHLRKAIRLGAGTAEIHNNLGVALMSARDPASAEESFLASLRLDPHHLDAHYNLARALLIQGKYDQGWQEFEWRWKWRQSKTHSSQSSTRKWAGEHLQGKRILLYAEQGLGDTLQFVRYCNMVKQCGARVVLQCQPALVKLLAANALADEVISTNESAQHDLVAALMSLPGVFRTNVDTIPAPSPYIAAPPSLGNTYKTLVGSPSSFRVGIAWQGNPEHLGDNKRSVPLRYFEPLAKVGRVELINLQHGFGFHQMGDINGRFSVQSALESNTCDDGFLRTAAIISNLHLVISVDTSIAHLSAAMGKPTWIALPAAPDWRWFSNRGDSPWYPTVKLFRNATDHWPEVFDRMAAELGRVVREKSI